MSNKNENFNLVDDKWIPVEGGGRVSLKDVFENSSLTAVGGNPLQKMAVYKLLFLIAQRSYGFPTESELRSRGQRGVAVECLDYLEKNKNLFYLYGEKPFLQHPELEKNDNIEYKTMYIDYLPDLASDNDSIVRDTQTRTSFSDADKALFLVTMQIYALGGKRVTSAKKYLLSGTADERSASARTSPSLSNGKKGYVQTLILGNSILETVFLNLFTHEDIAGINLEGLNTTILPPWEKMPTFEASDYNEEYKKSFSAFFVPMTRCILFGENNKLKYCEGLKYSGEWHDPFLTETGADGRKETVDVLKKPWNQIQALLAEVYNVEASDKKCLAVSLHYLRARETTEQFSIWSGGLGLDANSGDQYVKNEDDYLLSIVTFSCDALGDAFFSRYCSIIDKVNNCGIGLKKSIEAYKKQLGALAPGKRDTKAESVTGSLFSFWHEVGKLSEDFVSIAEKESEEEQKKLFGKLYSIERNIYDNTCQHGTARQMLAWAQNRP